MGTYLDVLEASSGCPPTEGVIFVKLFLRLSYCSFVIPVLLWLILVSFWAPGLCFFKWHRFENESNGLSLAYDSH